jgi:hypothetical protein
MAQKANSIRSTSRFVGRLKGSSFAERSRNNIHEGAITALTNCLDGVLEMLTVFHGASPDRDILANGRLISSRPWKGHLPPHISYVRKVRQSWPSVH